MNPPAMGGRIGLLMACALVSLSLFLIPLDSWWSNPFTSATMDAGHAVVFALLAMIVCKVGKPSRPRIVGYLVALVALAVGGELLQYFVPGRTTSLWDGLLSLGGIGSGLLIGGKTPVQRWVGSAALIALVGMTLLLRLLPWGIAVQHQAKAFPNLGFFDKPSALTVWRGVPQDTAEIIVFQEDDQRTLQIPIGKSSIGYTGAELLMESPSTRDWRSFESLYIKLSLSESCRDRRQSKATIGVRIDDQGPTEQLQDRYQEGFSIVPNEESQIIKIALDRVKQGPIDRELNLEQVRRIVIFLDASSICKPAALKITEVHLE